MDKFLKQYLLPLSVFVTGACVLVIEIVAVRVLSFYYGNTIFTVSSVISVILTALSIGYYMGGKFADRNPSLWWFFGIILVSGLTVLALHFVGMVILPILSITLSMVSGPLVSSLLLFLAPALLLGALSPYAVKLQSIQTSERGVGSVSGEIFFWSTLGSIVGSLLAGFMLIPYFGIDHIFIATGVLLFCLGFVPLVLLGFDKKRLTLSLFAVVILTLIIVLTDQQVKGDAVYSKDGVYGKIIIYDGVFDGRQTRFFQQDQSNSSAIFLDSDDPTDLVYEYTKYYSLYKIFKPNVQNALVIGGGAYSIPKALLWELPNATVDVSEIEPSLFDLAKKYFNANNSQNLHSYTEDGRRLLRDSNKKYDLMFSDVYFLFLSPPAQFTTREFFALAKEKLTDDGIFIANWIGDLSKEPPSLFFSEVNTFRSVFPNSYFFTVGMPETTDLQNMIVVGYNSNKKIDLSAASIFEHQNPIIRSLPYKAINLEKYDLSLYPVLTDNFAPVEYLTAKALRRAYQDAPVRAR